LGEYRFSRIVENSARVRIQEYKHDISRRPLWIAWTPTGENETISHTLARIPGKLTRAERMPLTRGEVRPENLADGSLSVQLNGSPLYLFFDGSAQ
jgi:hypothetical protein